MASSTLTRLDPRRARGLWAKLPTRFLSLTAYLQLSDTARALLCECLAIAKEFSGPGLSGETGETAAGLALLTKRRSAATARGLAQLQAAGFVAIADDGRVQVLGLAEMFEGEPLPLATNAEDQAFERAGRKRTGATERKRRQRVRDEEARAAAAAANVTPETPAVTPPERDMSHPESVTCHAPPDPVTLLPVTPRAPDLCQRTEEQSQELTAQSGQTPARVPPRPRGIQPPPNPEAGRIATLVRAKGFTECHAQCELLRQLIAKGITDLEILEACDAAKGRGIHSWNWAFKRAMGRRTDAARVASGLDLAQHVPKSASTESASDTDKKITEAPTVESVSKALDTAGWD